MFSALFNLILFSAYFKEEGKKFVYSTGEIIHPSDWDFKSIQPNNLNGRTAKAEVLRTIKRQLDRYSNFFIEITNRYRNSNQEITIEEDNFEECLTTMLIAAGIESKNIHTGLTLQKTS